MQALTPEVQSVIAKIIVAISMYFSIYFVYKDIVEDLNG